VKTLSLVIICVGFLAVNFVLRKLLANVKRKTGMLGFFNRYFPLAELAFWSIFSFWFITLLFDESRFFTYIIFLLFTLAFILFFWFFLRDYISGIQLKTRFNLSAGQAFKSEQVTGVIRKMTLLFIEVQAENGSNCKIPYSQIDQKSIELNIQEKRGGESLFSVDLNEDLNEATTSRKIAELIINSPWCSHKSNPLVTVKEAKKGLKTYEISCITNRDSGTRKLKELIEKNFSSSKS